MARSGFPACVVHTSLVYTSLVKNVTISLDEGLLEESREYAARQGTTLNQMVRDFLERTVRKRRRRRIESFLEWAESKKLAPKDGRWLTRDEVYDR